MLKLIKKFTGDRSGQFALMFALLSFPLLASAGMALDYANVSQQRGHIQNANDAAALWAAAYYRDNKSLPTPLATKSFIISNFPEEFGMEVGLPVLSYDDKEVTILAQVTLNTQIMHMFGADYQVSKVLSSASVDVDAILEFALALDTTGSMAYDGRLTGLKSAANNFITKIWEVVDDGADVKGAIVPFSNYVNVGTKYRYESWTNVPADVDTRKKETTCEKPVIGKTDCSGGTLACYPASSGVTPAVPAGCKTVGGGCSTDDGVTICEPTREECWPAKPATTWTKAAGCKTVGETCDPVYGPEECSTRETGELHTWHGVVSSLPYPQNLQDTGSQSFPGPLDEQAGSSLLRLTDKESSLKSKINGLVANGNTYIPDGIMWALRALSPEAPFTEGRAVYTGAPGQKRIRKAIILMTDGANTASPNFGESIPSSNPWKDAFRVKHTGTDWRDANDYTEEACNYVKDKGYEVYTVAFGTSLDATVKALMEDCASTPDDYYHAVSSHDLDDAFDEIANSLLRLRLTN